MVQIWKTQLKHHLWMCFRCATCAQVNPENERKTLEAIQAQGNGTGKIEFWTLLKSGYIFGYKYLFCRHFLRINGGLLHQNTNNY